MIDSARFKGPWENFQPEKRISDPRAGHGKPCLRAQCHRRFRVVRRPPQETTATWVSALAERDWPSAGPQYPVFCQKLVVVAISAHQRQLQFAVDHPFPFAQVHAYFFGNRPLNAQKNATNNCANQNPTQSLNYCYFRMASFNSKIAQTRLSGPRNGLSSKRPSSVMGRVE